MCLARDGLIINIAMGSKADVVSSVSIALGWIEPLASTMERLYLSRGKVKEKSDSNNCFEEDHPRATSWPAKQCYICSFCNRKFRSAQALGGHMNVHRRDRARLLLLPSAFSGSHNPTLKINPKSNFASSPSSSSAKILPRTHHPLHSSSFTSLSLCSLSSTSTASLEEEKKLVTDLLQLDPLSSQRKYITSKKRIRGIPEFEEIKGFGQKDTSTKLLKKEGAGSLDLEILKGSKQDLDLELRLWWF